MIYAKNIFLFLIVFGVFILSCEKQDDYTRPGLKSSIDTTKPNLAPFAVEKPLPEDKSIDVKELKIQWNHANDPENGQVVYDLYFGKNTASLQLIISNLKDNFFTLDFIEDTTNYFWRVITKDEFNNIAIGPMWSFKTALIKPSIQFNLLLHYDTLTDHRDGKKYRTIQIGEQNWMAQNIEFKTFDGSIYPEDDSILRVYGRLYNWETAQNVCPNGWHLPLKSEWDSLISYLGNDTVACFNLKETGSIFWNHKNINKSTNNSGFSAIAAGKVDNNLFSERKEKAYFWTANQDDLTKAYAISLTHTDSLQISKSKKELGYSVRCLKDQ